MLSGANCFHPVHQEKNKSWICEPHSSLAVFQPKTPARPSLLTSSSSLIQVACEESTTECQSLVSSQHEEFAWRSSENEACGGQNFLEGIVPPLCAYLHQDTLVTTLHESQNVAFDSLTFPARPLNSSHSPTIVSQFQLQQTAESIRSPLENDGPLGWPMT